MSLDGIILPEATMDLVKAAHSQVEEMGVVGFVDRKLALQMISEQRSYDAIGIPVESLIGAPILTELGIRAWMAVKESLALSWHVKLRQIHS